MTGDVVWVVGGSGAIGSAIASRLRRDGSFVIASSRNTIPERDAVPLDVRDADSVAGALRTIGAIDGLVVSVAIPGFGDFLELADDLWRDVFETKLFGSLRVIRAVLPGMIERKRGRIVLVTGRGVNPPPRHLPGASVNAALNLIVQGLGGRYAADGIRINAVAPGPIASPRLSALAGDGASARQGKPSDVADAVAFLLSEEARFINGTVLVADGGGARSVDGARP